MSQLTLDEVRNNALEFVKNHKNDSAERQQAQSWIKDFLEDIFGIHKRKVNAGFEWRVKTRGNQLYVDHLLNGILLIEMKSRGKSLDKAKSQAYQYVMKLKDEDIPKFVMICDFENIHLFNLDNNNEIRFPIIELPKYIETFNFLINKDITVTAPQSPVNREAAILLQELHSLLREMKYPKNASTLLMTRLVFCLFADDTGIFEKNQFRSFIVNNTSDDGSDLLDKISNLFVVLNTPIDKRYQSEEFTDFRYINGDLFNVSIPSGINLTKEVRDMLLEVSKLDWSQISPVIFGSMFEGALDDSKRHNLGAHYTSETSIMKVLNSLFLDDLYEKLESITEYRTGRLKRYNEFHEKLANLTFFDPACGSGNFLMLAYREIRRLENEVIQLTRIEEFLAENRSISSVSSEELRNINYQDSLFSIEDSVKVNVTQFHGIEIESYAASIAKLGLWLIDHLMNIETSEIFSHYFVRLPLDTGANIYALNALEVDWKEIISPRELDYIIGNPPFLGSKELDPEQRKSMQSVMSTVIGYKKLDYVAAWFILSVKMMDINPNIKASFVSTNSIVQGEQATILWNNLFANDIKINFAHQTFEWDNKGASVHVVITGFSKISYKENTIFKYNKINDTNPSEIVKTSNINQYLLNDKTIFIKSRRKPLSDGAPLMTKGSASYDNKHLQVNAEERNIIIKESPLLENFIPKLVTAETMINHKRTQSYILYLKDAPLDAIKKSKFVQNRLELVREFRGKSKRVGTKKLSDYPTLLGEDRHSNDTRLVIPVVSSSNREYLPISVLDDDSIISYSSFQIIDNDLFTFAILSTRIHFAWALIIGGKLKSDLRYSNTLVYNNFVFPKTTEKDKEKIREMAKDILNIREKYINKGNELGDLYSPIIMPPDLRKAHSTLDSYVESLYDPKGFNSDEDRVQHLVKLFKKCLM